MKPPSSLALHATPPALLARPSKPAQAGLEPRPSPPQGGRPPTARQSRFRGGKLGQLVGAAVLIALTGCSQQELYGQLSERQANEMVALLRNHGIDADKQRTKEGTHFALMVPSSGFAPSVELLHGAGYPRDEHDTLGGVFKKDGFITTQLEERARFMHALAQELASTIQSIDGVVLARVHLAVPEKRRFTEKPETSAASVFIKHRPGLDLSPQLGSIKALVVNAIEGLPYESVTVVTFAAEPWVGHVKNGQAEPTALAGLSVPLMAAAGMGGTALLAGGALWGWQRRRQTPGASRPGSTTLSPVSPAGHAPRAHGSD